MNSKEKKIKIISVPSDVGANTRGGAKTPEILVQSLKKNTFLEKVIEFSYESSLQKSLENSLNLKSIPETQIFRLCEIVKKIALESLKSKNIPVFLGGDHSLAIGSICGVNSHFIKKGQSLGLLWFDAHPDMNSPKSTETGNIHGMALSTLLGEGPSSLLSLVHNYSFLAPENIVLLGIRSVDRLEQKILDESGLTYYTMRQIRKEGISEVFQKVQDRLIKRVDALHLSFDLDVMDPSLAPAVNTPVKEGMVLAELEFLLKAVASSKKISSMDFVEYNPVNEKEGKGLAMVHKIFELVFLS